MTHPTNDSLKPCPFCGGAASLHPRTCDKNTPYNPADRAFPVARCGQCGAEALGKDWGKPETAAEKWNTRALLAEQAQEPKAEDAELLDWLEEKHYALHPIKEAAGDDQYTLWWQVSDKRKSISGHPLGNIRAAIRAARAAERKA